MIKRGLQGGGGEEDFKEEEGDGGGGGREKHNVCAGVCLCMGCV